MSEIILQALTRLFGIITKQAGGATEAERDFVFNYFAEQLDQDSIDSYKKLYENVSDYGKPGPERISVGDSVRILRECQQINRDLEKEQKVLVLIKLLELIAADGNFSKQRRQIIDTVSEAFNIVKNDYKVVESFVLETAKEKLNFEDILIASKYNDIAPESNLKHILLKDEAKISGEVIFLWVRSAEIYFVKYNGDDNLTLNGFPMKKNQVYPYSSGSSIKTSLGSGGLYYSDITSIFLDTFKNAKISFIAQNIEYKFPNGALGLRDVSISETQGKLIGIMGGSGAGKTTLLNVLSGIEKPTNGAVLINGIDIHRNKDKAEGVIGYVAQDDLLIEELSVYQNLYYNAKLCFKNLGEKEIEDLVISVLESLGLDHIKDLKVGNVLNKKISGGQRKRLNIALELIREPAVMFVDEPTSGLSSRDSGNVIDLLKELSLKGKLIFVVIHQPSLDIYKTFDKMIILDKGGYPVYYGNPVEAIPYFKKGAKQVDGDRTYLNPEQIFDIMERQVVDEYGQYTNKRKMTPEQWNTLYKENFIIEEVETIMEKPPSSLQLPNLLFQTFIFTIRDFLSKVSNQQYMLINLLEAPVLALLLAYVIRFQNDPEDEFKYNFMYNDNIPAFILICIIIALFMGLTVSAEEIIRDRKIQKRERFLNLSRAAYLFSKVIILFLLSAIQTFTFVLVGNLILEIRGELFSYWIVLFSVSCFANMLGLNISSTFNSVVTIYITIPLLLIPQMILSGIIFKYDKMNDVLTPKDKVPLVADIMVSRWAYEAIAVDHYINNYYETDYYEIEKEESIFRFKDKYWVPELRKKVDRVLENIEKKDNNDSIVGVIKSDLTVLRNELGADEYYAKFLAGIEPEEDLQPEVFNKKIGDKVHKYLNKVSEDAIKKMNNATKEKDKTTEEFENGDPDYKEIQQNYYNEELSRLVKKEESLLEGVIEYDGRLVQKIDPIYNDPRDDAPWYDYRTHFLAPKKHFAGILFDTYRYNLFVIWLLTFVLYFTLYFDFFKSFSLIFEKINFKKDKS